MGESVICVERRFCQRQNRGFRLWFYEHITVVADYEGDGKEVDAGVCSLERGSYIVGPNFCDAFVEAVDTKT